MEYIFEIGDIIELKKKHPCGSNRWEITRKGADFKIRCIGCGHVLMIERDKLKKIMKKKIDNKI